MLLREVRDDDVEKHYGGWHLAVYDSNGTDFGAAHLLFDTEGRGIGSTYYEAATGLVAGVGVPLSSESTKMAGGFLHFAKPIDVNGDGLVDILIGPNVYVREGGRVDLLTGVVDGLGHDALIGYRSLGDRNPSPPVGLTPFYARTADSPYPLYGTDKGVWAVSEVDVDDGTTTRNQDPAACGGCGTTGSGNYNRSYYRYENGRNSLVGGEWLGFTRRGVYDAARGLTTTTDYDTTSQVLGHEYWGRFRPISEETTGIALAHDTDVRNNDPVTYRHRQEFGYQVLFPSPLSTFGSVYAVVPSRVFEEETDTRNGTLALVKRIETRFDDYDLLGNAKTKTHTVDGAESTVETTTYDNRDWILGLPLLTVTQSIPSNGEPAVTRTVQHSYEYPKRRPRTSGRSRDSPNWVA